MKDGSLPGKSGWLASTAQRRVYNDINVVYKCISVMRKDRERQAPGASQAEAQYTLNLNIVYGPGC